MRFCSSLVETELILHRVRETALLFLFLTCAFVFVCAAAHSASSLLVGSLLSETSSLLWSLCPADTMSDSDSSSVSDGQDPRKRKILSLLDVLGIENDENDLSEFHTKLLQNIALAGCLRVADPFSEADEEEIEEALAAAGRVVEKLEEQQDVAPAEPAAPPPKAQLKAVYANTSRHCAHWCFWVDGKTYELLFSPHAGANSSAAESSGLSDLHIHNIPSRPVNASKLMGYTTLSHEEIKVIGHGIIEEKYKDYNILINNCQGYTRDLLKAILTNPIQGLTITSSKVLIVLVSVVFILILAVLWQVGQSKLESGLQNLEIRTLQRQNDFFIQSQVVKRLPYNIEQPKE